MPTRSFASRMWTALVTPVPTTERRPVPPGAGVGSRLWAALTRNVRPATDEFRHEGAELNQDAQQRYEAAVARLAEVDLGARRQAIRDLVVLADEHEPLRQTCIDALCSYLRMPQSGHTEDETTTLARSSSRRKHVLESAEREFRCELIEIIAARLRDSGAVSWQNCDFNFAGMPLEGVNFSQVRFGGQVDFTGCGFNRGTVAFARAMFSGTVNFTDCGFNQATVDFSEAMFVGDVDFTGCGFNRGTVAFARAMFSGTVNFTDCGFNGGALDFTGVYFSGGCVDFTGAVFNAGKIDFTGAHFAGGTVDLHAPRAYTRPPVFDAWSDQPPSGLLLPEAA